MANDESKQIGAISWMDLTVENASQVRDFYQQVVGWNTSSIDMQGYEDYCMNRPEDGQTVAGICHARGSNADQPAQWMIYINVADLDGSMARCRENGGEVVVGPRSLGGDRFCVIKDPAGAVAALYESKPKD